MSDGGRIRRFKKGINAERYAALWLRCKGYQILETRYKTPVGEIDLIARRGKTYAFIEVKARANFTKAKESITPHQRRRIERAASLFASNIKATNSVGAPLLRFDAILVSGWKIKHLESAWRMSE